MPSREDYEKQFRHYSFHRNSGASSLNRAGEVMAELFELAAYYRTELAQLESRPDTRDICDVCAVNHSHDLTGPTILPAEYVDGECAFRPCGAPLVDGTAHHSAECIDRRTRPLPSWVRDTGPTPERMSEERLAFVRANAELVADVDKWKGGLTAHAIACQAVELCDALYAERAELTRLRERVEELQGYCDEFIAAEDEPGKYAGALATSEAARERAEKALELACEQIDAEWGNGVENIRKRLLVQAEGSET